MSTYEKSIVELDRATGLTLAHAGIEIEQAVRGEVQQVPHFEGVAPRKDSRWTSRGRGAINPQAGRAHAQN
jgi:hypothetical protein